MLNLLLTGAFPYTVEQKNQLGMLGCKIYFLQYEKDDLPCPPEYVDAIIGNGIFLYHDISKFTNLKFIQLTSAGFDRVPLEYIKSHHIELFNAKGVYSIPMAEWVMCKVLDIYKKTAIFHQSQKNIEWKKQRDLMEIHGKTVGILGAGNIGQEVAKRFFAFDAKVIGFDVRMFQHPFFNEIHLIQELDEWLEHLDILVLTLPLLDSTRHLITFEKLQRMKDSSILVNISRGAIIDEKGLIESLKDGHPAFAALDVFEEEPLFKDSSLWEMENVYVSPHNSFVSDGNHERLFSIMYSNLKAYIQS